MLHHRDNSGRKVDPRWHAFREDARRDAYSKEEFSDIDQERYDLDTAGITGEDNPESYTGREGIADIDGTLSPADLDEDPTR